MDSFTLARAFEDIRAIVQKGPTTLTPHEVVEEVRRLKEADGKSLNLVKAAADHFRREETRNSSKP